VDDPTPCPGPQAHQDILASGGSLVKIPIETTHVRSLNLAVSVGVGVFEALRQLDAGRHGVAPRDDSLLPRNQLHRPAAVDAAGAQGLA
jgi:hypothetical protein